MALGDLASLKVHLGTFSLTVQSAVGMQCTSPAANWRDLLATEFLATVMPDWLACLSSQVRLQNITVSDVVPGTAVDVILAPIPQPGGGQFQSSAAANCAYVVSLRSDGIGRNTRGRFYMYGMPANGIVGTVQWDSAQQGLVQNLVEVLLAQYGPTGFSTLARLVVISRGPHGSPLPVPESFPITHCTFVGRVRSMRKRLRL